jgi:hypothetical protein
VIRLTATADRQSWELLPKTLASEKTHQGSWRIFKSNRHILYLHQTALLPASDSVPRSPQESVRRIKDNEPLHASALDDEVGTVCRTRRWHGVVVDGNRATQHDPRFEVDAREDFIQDRPADIVEEDLDPIGTKRWKPFADIFALVIDGAVEPRLFNQPLTFGGTPGSTDDKAPLILAIWPTTESRTADRTRDNNRLTRFTWPTSIIPRYAVGPVMPNRLNARLGGTPSGNLRISMKPLPSVAS